MKLRPWNNIKINECNEPLTTIPETIFRLIDEWDEVTEWQTGF